jgi:hypothetical protein
MRPNYDQHRRTCSVCGRTALQWTGDPDEAFGALGWHGDVCPDCRERRAVDPIVTRLSDGTFHATSRGHTDWPNPPVGEGRTEAEAVADLRIAMRAWTEEMESASEEAR